MCSCATRPVRRGHGRDPPPNVATGTQRVASREDTCWTRRGPDTHLCPAHSRRPSRHRRGRWGSTLLKHWSSTAVVHAWGARPASAAPAWAMADSLPSVITGSSGQVDRRLGRVLVGGIANPLEVIERSPTSVPPPSDELQTLSENKANRTASARPGIFDGPDDARRWRTSSKPTRPPCSARSRRASVPARSRGEESPLLQPHEGRPVHHPDAGVLARSSTCSTTFR